MGIVQGAVDTLQRLALQHRGLIWLAGEFQSDDDSAVGDVGDALHLQRRDEMRPEFGVLHQCDAGLLDRLAGLLDIRGMIEANVELDRRPVAAGIGQ